ncbi:MAG: PTS sugar transporter subunit IIA [Selenomonas sp.]|nr:PTS sugar transporter subunit IIA [Selenomonas sp.]
MFHENQIVFLEDSFSSKNEVIHHLTHRENSAVRDADQYERDVLEREASFATYTIDGVAMPHAKSEGVGTPFVAFARLKTPVRWGTEEGEDARMVFLIGVPKVGGTADNNLHLKILAALSKKLIHDEFRAQLSTANSTKDIYALLQEIEGALR